MGTVRTSISKAGLALGIEPSSVVRLIEAGGLDGDVEERTVECDLTWSRRDLWQRLVSNGYEFGDETEVTEVVELKRMLNVQDELWDDQFLTALVEVRGRQRLLGSEARTLLRGPDEVRKVAVARYGELAAKACATGKAIYYPPMEIEEVLEDLPEEMYALPGTCLDPHRSILFERPEPSLAGRVGAMPSGHLKSVATLVLLAHPTHGGLRGRLPAILALLERLVEWLGRGKISDVKAMGRFLSENADKVADREGALATVNSYYAIRELIEIYLEWQKPDPQTKRGKFLLSLLPAPLPVELKKLLWSEREKITVEALKARAISAGEVARRASDRLVCLEARLRQCDRLNRVVDQRIARIEKDFAAGKQVRFPVRVSDAWRVVRPDGTVAPGLRQMVSLEIVQEDTQWLEATKASGWDRNVEVYLDGATRASSPLRTGPTKRVRDYAPPVDGRYFQPGGDRRLFVRYVDTKPVKEDGDEHHPPFWVELYAKSALVTSRHMSREQVRERRAFVDRVGLERGLKAMMGLSWWPERNNHNLAHYILRYTGRVLLPLRSIRLMLAYGTAIARMELMSGTRIGETMQARQGGCFKEVEVKGQMRPTMRGRPKGWSRDRLWIIDPHTMELLKRIKQWAIEMWYADLGELPIVAYGERNKNLLTVQCPPAKYLFQVGGRAAKNEILNRCLRVATLGLPHAKSHDYRYAFGKLLAIRKATKRQRARAMSHEEDSGMVEQYGDWDCEGLEDDDFIVAELQNALQQEILDKLLDGGLDGIDFGRC